MIYMTIKYYAWYCPINWLSVLINMKYGTGLLRLLLDLLSLERVMAATIYQVLLFFVCW